MSESESTILDARRAAVDRMRREYLSERRAYEEELNRRGVSGTRRERLLAEFEAEASREVRAYERWFRANLQRRNVAP